MNEKRNKIMLVVLLVALIIVIILLSYAAFRFLGEGQRENVITSGTLKLNLVEGNTINLVDTYPLTDSEGLALDGYDFTLQNTGTASVDYVIYLDNVEIESPDVKLDEMYLKYKTSVPDQDVFNTINTIISYMEKAFKNVKKKLPASYTITQYLTIRRNMNILTTISPEEYYQRYVKNILEDKNIRHSIATLTKGGWNHSLSVMRNITTLVERAMLRTTIWEKFSNKNSTAA